MTTTVSERRDRPAEHSVPADVHLIASARTLDGFPLQLRDGDGVDVRKVAPGTDREPCAPGTPVTISWSSNPRPGTCSSAVVIGSPCRQKRNSLERLAAAAC